MRVSRLLRVSPGIRQLAAIGAPLLAFILTVFVVYPGIGSYHELLATIKTQQKQLEALKNTPPPAPERINPVGSAGRTEQPQFLGAVSMMAAAAGCVMDGLESQGAAATASKEQFVVPLRSHVVVVAPFGNVRRFLEFIAGAPRLYTVTDLTVSYAGSAATASNADRTVKATIGLERYIPAPPSPAPAAAAGSTGGSSTGSTPGGSTTGSAASGGAATPQP